MNLPSTHGGQATEDTLSGEMLSPVGASAGFGRYVRARSVASEAAAITRDGAHRQPTLVYARSQEQESGDVAGTRIIHDSRIMGTVAACILARIHDRRGDSVHIEYDRRGLHTREFWSSVNELIDAESYDKIVLCGVTFDEVEPKTCHRTIADLASRTRLEIWSHRWPDGYSQSTSVDQVFVPQYDLYTSVRHEISDSELTLFRLAQIIYRDLPTEQISDDDRLASRGLDDLFESEPESLFAQLRSDDAESVLQVLQRRGEELAGVPEPTAAIAAQHSIRPVLSFDLDPQAQGREESHINRYARRQELEESCIAVATRFFGDTERIYVTRPKSTGSRPSVEWLLGNASDPQVAGLSWLGPQDAKHCRLPSVLTEGEKLALRDAIVEEAKRVHLLSDGERRPPAGLVKFIHEVATSALRNTDLLGTHTRSSDAVAFSPELTRLLLDRGNRTDQVRSTLVLHLDVRTLGGAVFLFGNGGYNFEKLERLIEGSLLGLHAGASSWVGSIELPRRVRINANLSADVDVSDLPAALRVSSTRGIEVERAFESHAIEPSSRIGTSLRELQIETLVVLSESETIGPSIPYALLTSELCRQLNTSRGAAAESPSRRFEVLDLFAGSGVTARVLLKEIPNVQVLSVDLMIRSAEVKLADVQGVTWITADARTVIGDHGLVDRRFDVVCMDPPHALLLDLVFGHAMHEQPLIERVAEAADWLVLYIGHATQRGRRRIVDELAGKSYQRRAWFQIGQEVVMVGGPNAAQGKSFDDVVTSVVHAAAGRLQDAGWALQRIEALDRHV